MRGLYSNIVVERPSSPAEGRRYVRVDVGHGQTERFVAGELPIAIAADRHKKGG